MKSSVSKIISAAVAIAMIAIVMKSDPYVIDTLMRDLVAHSRSATAFLVYLQLYRYTHGMGRETVAMSHAVLADLIGISKRAVQAAIAQLAERRLIRKKKSRPTAVPVYTVLTPWVRKAAS
jgi:CRP-like cAMP-binding protein